MKILDRSNLGSLGTLALGVVIAWSVTLPRQTTGEQFRGNCKPCITELLLNCPPKVAGEICRQKAYQCVPLPTGQGICYRGSGSPCLWDVACQAQWHEACVGS